MRGPPLQLPEGRSAAVRRLVTYWPETLEEPSPLPLITLMMKMMMKIMMMMMKVGRTTPTPVKKRRKKPLAEKMRQIAAGGAGSH